MEFIINQIIRETVEKSNYIFSSEEDFRSSLISCMNIKYKKEIANGELLILSEYGYKNKKDTEPKAIDVYIIYKDKKYAIELKYRPKKFSSTEEEIILKNKTKIRKKHENGFNKVTIVNKYGNIVEYTISEQTTPYLCLQDVDKMLDYVFENNDCEAYAVTLYSHDWINKITGETDYEIHRGRGDKHVKFGYLNTNKYKNVECIQNPVQRIKDNTAHEGFYLQTYTIKRK